MQENILLLKGVEMLVLADQRAEGMDWCQVAATRGFPDFCVMLHTHTHNGKKKLFFSPLHSGHEHSLLLRKKTQTSLSCTGGKQALTQRTHRYPCAPIAAHHMELQGSSFYGTNTFNLTLTVRSWETHREPAARAGISILIAEVTAGKQGCYLRLLSPLNSVRNVWFLLFSANYLQCWDLFLCCPTLAVLTSFQHGFVNCFLGLFSSLAFCYYATFAPSPHAPCPLPQQHSSHLPAVTAFSFLTPLPGSWEWKKITERNPKSQVFWLGFFGVFLVCWVGFIF